MDPILPTYAYHQNEPTRLESYQRRREQLEADQQRLRNKQQQQYQYYQHDDLGRIVRPILPHQSNYYRSAHSREGYYPRGEIMEVNRTLEDEYKENRDQPQHSPISTSRPRTQENGVKLITSGAESPPLHVQLATFQQAQRKPSTTTPRPTAKQTPAMESYTTRQQPSSGSQTVRLFPTVRYHPTPVSVSTSVKRRHPKPRSPPLTSRQSAYSPSRSLAAPTHEQFQGHQPVYFDPNSPRANFNALRASQNNEEVSEKADGQPNGLTGLMSSLTPRTHSREHQLSQFQSNQPSSTSTTPSLLYHPSVSGRPGTSPYIESFPHPRPWLPNSTTQARAIFIGKTNGPFLSTEGPWQQTKSCFREEVDTSIKDADGKKVKPFIFASTARTAADQTKIDYFFNSPDEQVKKLSMIWTRQQAKERKQQFLEELKKLQAKERQQQAERAGLLDEAEGSKRRNGRRRIGVSEALPPRPLALDNWQDANRIRYLGN